MKSFRLIAVLISTFMFTGCLRNLNVTEFFRKLEIKNPEYYSLISDNKGAFEEAIKSELEDDYNSDIEWITFWGESRYACGNVIYDDGEDVFVVVKGEVQFEGWDETVLYDIRFVPTEDLQLEKVLIY